MELLPIGLFWCLTFWSLFQRQHILIYLFFGTMPFVSFAAIPPALTGGLTLTPTPIIALVIVAKQMTSISGIKIAIVTALRASELLYLFLFWLIAGIFTIFMPRFFANQVEVLPVRSTGLLSTAMLQPTTQNLSTFIYVSVSVLSVFAFSRLLRPLEMRIHILNALCLGAAITVVTGILDFVSQQLNLQSFLEIFRTASYALLVDDEVMDSKRVVGLMPEASSFGGLALNFLAALYFFKRSMPKGILRDRTVPLLIILLVLFIWLSTSSSAYLGLAMFGFIAIIEWLWRLIKSQKDPSLNHALWKEFFFFAFAIFLLMVIFLAAPYFFDPFLKMVDLMIFQKSSSTSFEDRNITTQVSWNALLATYGLGVGLGGTRASNFLVSMISNTGVLATSFYLLFVILFLFFLKSKENDMQGKALISACRWSYFPPFFAIITVGTTPDFGLFNAFFYGLAIAIAHKSSRHFSNLGQIAKVSPKHAGFS